MLLHIFSEQLSSNDFIQTKYNAAHLMYTKSWWSASLLNWKL